MWKIRILLNPRIADKEEGFSMEFGRSAGWLWDIVTVTGRRKAVCEQFSWCRYSGIKFFHFCGDESAGQLRKDGADDRETADLFSLLSSGSRVSEANVSKKGISGSRFHMWLPVQGFISPDTYFLESTPYITVTAPGDSTRGVLPQQLISIWITVCIFRLGEGLP